MKKFGSYISCLHAFQKLNACSRSGLERKCQLDGHADYHIQKESTIHRIGIIYDITLYALWM